MVFELQTDDDLLKEKIDQFLIKIEGKENQNLKFENGKSIQDTSMDFLSFSLISPDGKVLQLKKLEPDDVHFLMKIHLSWMPKSSHQNLHLKQSAT